MSELTSHDRQAYLLAEEMTSAASPEDLRYAYGQAYEVDDDVDVEYASKTATLRIVGAFASAATKLGLDLASPDERIFALHLGMDSTSFSEPETFGPDVNDAERGGTVFWGAMHRILSAADVQRSGNSFELIQPQGIALANLSKETLDAGIRYARGRELQLMELDGHAAYAAHATVGDPGSPYWGSSILVVDEYPSGHPMGNDKELSVTLDITTGTLKNESVTGIAHNRHLTSELWLPAYAAGYIPPVMIVQEVVYGEPGEGPNVDTADGFVRDFLLYAATHN